MLLHKENPSQREARTPIREQLLLAATKESLCTATKTQCSQKYKRKRKPLTTANVGEDMEQQELSFIASENAKWYRHFEGHFGAFLQN